MAYLGNTVTTQGFTPAVDFFSGNASTTAFTLSRPVASVAQIEAVIENVPQNPGSAYTVSGSTITFTSAPPSGTNNIYVYYTSPITQVIQPSQGTVNTTQLGTITNIASGSSSLTLQTGASNTTAMTIDTSQNVGIGTTTPKVRLNGKNLSINGADSGVSYQASIELLVNGASAGELWANSNDFVIGSYSTQPMIFRTQNTERMRIDSSGNLLVGLTTNSYNSKFTVQSDASATTPFSINDTSTGSTSRYITTWYRGGSSVGNISITNTTTAYNTSSDYRLKENIAPMTGALDKVAQLKPVTYTWKETGDSGQGFIAHELQEVVPDCVSGSKDAVDADGNPVYQGIDTSFLVATLVASIQELKQIVDAQATEIAELKAKVG